MEKTYQEIVNVLVEIIPEDWSEIYLYAEYGEGYKKVFFYYYPTANEKPIYSLDIPHDFKVDVENHNIMRRKLYDLFEVLWMEFKEQDQEQWTLLTFILDNTGEMKIDYSYEDIADLSPTDKQDEWEAKYLTKGS